MENLKNKTAIITGAAQGIGKEIALVFAGQGANLVLGDINYEGVKETAKEIEKSGGTALAVDVDLGEPLQINHLVQRAINRFGQVDTLINNAAYVKKVACLDYSVEEWKHVIDVSLNGYFFLSQAAAKEMSKKGGGKIINIASIVGFIAHSGLMAYAVSKAGVLAMTKILSHELRKYNISVNAIAPGPTDTPLMKDVMGKFNQGEEKISSKAMGKGSDVALAALMLARDENNSINGNIINVGGGILGEL